MNQNSKDILLIEDDLLHASLLTRWIESTGQYKVTHFANGEDALDNILETNWAVIVSDIDLPGISGFEVAAFAKSEDINSPLLLITAQNNIDIAMQAIDHKVDGFLLKPFEKNKLLEEINKLYWRPRSRRKNEREKVLAIGAHPDDVEIGCGGILLRHRANNDDITILTLSSGENGGSHSLRKQESESAAEFLKATLYIEDLPDTAISEGATTIQAIENIIKLVSPTIIYTHTAKDAHQDHRNTHFASMVASRNVPNLFCYQSPSSTIDFRPNNFVEISEYIEDKINLISFYNTQVTTRDYLKEDMIFATARYWGRFSQYKDVEPLETIRAVS